MSRSKASHSNSDPSVKQRSLPGVEDVVYLPKLKAKGKRWFYVIQETNQMMLYGFDPSGYPVWVEHDLITFEPMRYVGKDRAKFAARNYGGDGVRWYRETED